MKEDLKINNTNQEGYNLNPVIKISHFDDDKHVRTDTFPISHFLDQTSRQIKSIRYS